jgi:hypothetical protein
MQAPASGVDVAEQKNAAPSGPAPAPLAAATPVLRQLSLSERTLHLAHGLGGWASTQLLQLRVPPSLDRRRAHHALVAALERLFARLQWLREQVTRDGNSDGDTLAFAERAVSDVRHHIVHEVFQGTLAGSDFPDGDWERALRHEANTASRALGCEGGLLWRGAVCCSEAAPTAAGASGWLLSVLVTFHHAAADGRSVVEFVEQLVPLFAAFASPDPDAALAAAEAADPRLAMAMTAHHPLSAPLEQLVPRRSAALQALDDTKLVKERKATQYRFDATAGSGDRRVDFILHTLDEATSSGVVAAAKAHQTTVTGAVCAAASLGNAPDTRARLRATHT